MTLTQDVRSTQLAQATIGLAWRAIVVLAATAAILLQLPAWVRAPLAIIAGLVTILYCLRRFARRSPVDRVLTAVGALIVGLGLLGLLLNVLPWGLSALGWGVGVGVVQLAVLVIVTYVRPEAAAVADGRLRIRPSGYVWGVLIIAVLAGSLSWASASFSGTHGAPLALSGVPSGDSLKVTISSSTGNGTYDLVRSTGSGSSVIKSSIAVGPDAPVTLTVPLHQGTRETIELVKTGQTAPLRELILDTRSSVVGVTN